VKNFNIVNVLDTELTCYPDNIFPPGEQKEIIQIGLSMVDLRSLTIVKRVSIPVVPQMSKISQYCTDLPVGLTPNSVDKALLSQRPAGAW